MATMSRFRHTLAACQGTFHPRAWQPSPKPPQAGRAVILKVRLSGLDHALRNAIDFVGRLRYSAVG